MWFCNPFIDNLVESQDMKGMPKTDGFIAMIVFIRSIRKVRLNGQALMVAF